MNHATTGPYWSYPQAASQAEERLEPAEQVLLMLRARGVGRRRVAMALGVAGLAAGHHGRERLASSGRRCRMGSRCCLRSRTPPRSPWRSSSFVAAALEHDIHVSVSPGGTRDGRFLPNGIGWVVERLFAWLSRYRRLNIVYDRAADLFAGHIWIAVISIIARRLVAQTQAQQGV